MPEYEYACSKCGKAFVVFSSLKELEAKPTVKCSTSVASLQRQARNHSAHIVPDAETAASSPQV
jgi:putative FmdB family regulatory protein